MKQPLPQPPEPSEASIKLAEKLLAKKLCEEDHLFFTRYFFKKRQGIKFRVNWHHVYMAEIVQDVIDGRRKNVVINVSPGSSKTEEVVINVIARGLALNPRARFLHISYSDDLALLNSETAREIVGSDEYADFWPLALADDAKSKKRWNVVSDDRKAGGVYAVSLGGQITGFRAGHMAEGWQGCFPVGTKVWTEVGMLDIDRIVRERMAVNVWAYDYAGNMVLRPVIGWHENPPNDIVRVTFDDGATVECTPDHKFWTAGRGWVRADSLRVDDRLPCVNGGVKSLDDIDIDADCNGGRVQSATIFDAGSIGAIGNREFHLFCGEFGSVIGAPTTFCADILSAGNGCPAISAPYLIDDSEAHTVDGGKFFGRYAFCVVDLDSLLIGQEGARMNAGFAECAMCLAVEDVGRPSVVSQVGVAVVGGIAICMANFESFRARAMKCSHNSPMNRDSLDAITTHARVKPEVATSLFLRGENALALNELDAILSSNSPGFALDATKIGDAVGAFISGDRAPVLVEYVRHDSSTFCLTVDEYHNFTVENGIVVKNCILIDDPLKVEDAYSKTNRDKANRKLVSTVKSRKANPDTPIIMIMQRLAEEDPTGFIEAGGLPGKWDIIKIPALIDDAYVATLPEHIQKLVDDGGERDEDGRFSYWPYKEPLAELLAMERAADSRTRQVMAGQYMQKPAPEGGDLIRGAWFQRYSVLPEIRWRKIYADTAQKTGERNDYSVFACWGMGVDNKIYLLDLLRGKWEAPELERKAVEFWNKHLPTERFRMGPLRKMMVEMKASGTGLVQSIKAKGKIAIEGVERNTDKLIRVKDIAGYIESGLVCIPDDAPWVLDYVAECEAFTADDTHAHDDMVDVTCDACSDMLSKPANIYSAML